MRRALLVLIAMLLAVPALPAAGQTADDDYAALRERFQNLFDSITNQRGLLPEHRRIVRAVRDDFSAFAAEWPDDPRGPAGILQLSMWLGDDGAVMEASETLLEMRPDDDGIRLALIEHFKRKNRFDRALNVAGDHDFDVETTPLAFVALAECLFAEQRFQQALDMIEPVRDNIALKGRVDLLVDQIETTMELWSEEQALRSSEAGTGDLPRLEIETDKGLIVVELFENEAPNTVANFVSLAESGFYAGTKFHRVEQDPPMAQGGDPNSRDGNPGIPGQGDPGYKIKDEHTEEPYRKHFTGSLAMAKTAAPNTAGCQFYITTMPIPHLNGRHTVFGRVVEGLVVARSLEVDDEILGIKVTRKRVHDYVPETISTTPATPFPAPTTPPTP